MSFSLLSCARNYYVVTTSVMEPNIMAGDKVHILKTSEYTYGEVVLVEIRKSEHGLIGAQLPEKYCQIYRIVGLPNDTIEINANFCTINHIPSQIKIVEELTDRDGFKIKKIEELLPVGIKTMLYVGDVHQLDSLSNMSAKIIPQNEYFVLGDYRTASMDSRFFGAFPTDRIRGKVTKIVKGRE